VLFDSQWKNSYCHFHAGTVNVSHPAAQATLTLITNQDKTKAWNEFTGFN